MKPIANVCKHLHLSVGKAKWRNEEKTQRIHAIDGGVVIQKHIKTSKRAMHPKRYAILKREMRMRGAWIR